MRIVFVNPAPIFHLDSTSHQFWYSEFRRRATSGFLWIKKHNWNPVEIANFKPDHIHFAGDALPRVMWMSIERIMALKLKCPETPITSYRGGIGKEEDYLNRLNKIVDKAFGSTDYYENQEWMPAPSDPQFWKGTRNPKIRIVCIAHGSKEHIKAMKKWKIPFTKHKPLISVSRYFPLYLIGSGWSNWGLQHIQPTQSYEENKRYYLESLIGLNVIHDGLKKFPKYWSNRLMHMLMSGLPCVTPMQPGLDKIFSDGENIILYNDDNELIKKLRYYMAEENRHETISIGLNGMKLATNNWNTKTTVDKILKE